MYHAISNVSKCIGLREVLLKQEICVGSHSNFLVSTMWNPDPLFSVYCQYVTDKWEKKLHFNWQIIIYLFIYLFILIYQSVSLSLNVVLYKSNYGKPSTIAVMSYWDIICLLFAYQSNKNILLGPETTQIIWIPVVLGGKICQAASGRKTIILFEVKYFWRVMH